jgi:hypothetical protein
LIEWAFSVDGMSGIETGVKRRESKQDVFARTSKEQGVAAVVEGSREVEVFGGFVAVNCSFQPHQAWRLVSDYPANQNIPSHFSLVIKG